MDRYELVTCHSNRYFPCWCNIFQPLYILTKCRYRKVDFAPFYIFLKPFFHEIFQAASPTDDESTMTFHDALSDDEDVLIADLELDEEEDDRRHRKSDIVDLDSIPLS